MIIKLTNDQRDIVDHNNGLKRYLTSLDEGHDFTPRSWLYEHVEPIEILQVWKEHLELLSDGSFFEQEVFHFDISQEAKWGPQGGVAPISKLMEIIKEGFHDGDSPSPSAFSTKEWKQAKQAVIAIFRSIGLRGNLRPASYDSVVEDMRVRDTLESNSGWPLFTRRSKPEVKQASVSDAITGKWRDYPAIALFRNYNNKTRLVWMFPMSTNLVEGAFFQPLQSSLMRRNIPFLAPWKGFDTVRDLISAVYIHNDCISASDFSSTDAHFQVSTTLEVFDVIKTCFQKQYHDALRESLVHMHKIPLMLGPDSMITGFHGVSSGSNWTNFIETIFDWILAEYVRIKFPEAKATGLFAIGDDMAWRLSEFNEGFAQLLDDVGKQVGQVIKAEKTTNEENKVKSLQRLFQRGYSRPDGLLRGVYPTIRALKSAIYPERFHDPRKWSSDMFCARIFMILENCVDHPLFEEFVRFVVNGNKHLIPFAKQGKAQLDRVLRESKLLPGLNPTYNQERRDHSFADFASIRFAATL